jgi:16S rRNA (cytidine1402-2'-O)-methyltransferase
VTESCEHGALVLVPVALGETPWASFLPPEAHARVSGLRHFVVETEKTARLQLKRLAHPSPLRELDIRSLPETGPERDLDALLAPALAGEDIGLMSDAGCPGVADPGARLVARAHALGITVVPLVGPSSILLALMASGLNGQSFAFHGYLPVDDAERDQRIRQLEEESRHLGRTQLFIETPYRNDRMYAALLATCKPDTRLCLARDLTTRGEWIGTHAISTWRRQPAPDLARRPAIFLMLAAHGGGKRR